MLKTMLFEWHCCFDLASQAPGNQMDYATDALSAVSTDPSDCVNWMSGSKVKRACMKRRNKETVFFVN